jgi:hypothetical protein
LKEGKDGIIRREAPDDGPCGEYKMNERMLDKQHQPTEEEIKQFIGSDSCKNIQLIEDTLKESFDLHVALKFPFGNTYGWGYKFSHKTKHLFYLFFENKSLTIMTQIADPKNDREHELINGLSEEGRKCWESKYPCNTGGWVTYRFSSRAELKDVGIFMSLRTKKNIIFE